MANVAIVPKSRSFINATTTASHLDAACFTCAPATAFNLLFVPLLNIIIIIIITVIIRSTIITARNLVPDHCP